MGEIAVARGDAVLRTLLGSCLGLALYERRQKVGALAHIVLPASLGRTEHPGKFVDTAVPAMIGLIRELSDDAPLRLQAKFAGGANMFAASDQDNTIGTQNIKALEQALGQFRIPIAGRHCGGEQGRRMRFDLATGIVTIDIVGADSVTL